MILVLKYYHSIHKAGAVWDFDGVESTKLSIIRSLAMRLNHLEIKLKRFDDRIRVMEESQKRFSS